MARLTSFDTVFVVCGMVVLVLVYAILRPRTEEGLARIPPVDPPAIERRVEHPIDVDFEARMAAHEKHVELRKKMIDEAAQKRWDLRHHDRYDNPVSGIW